MNSEVNITLTGSTIPSLFPIGASVSYGINNIPTATVQLDPRSLALLCDFDNVRRHDVTLSIKTDNGCIHFDGVIDGFSISQQPASLNTSLVIKHKFTYLNEIYPRILGLNAGTSEIFAINSPTTINASSLATSDAPTGTTSLLEDFQQVYGYVATNNLPMNTNVIDFIVNLAKTIVNSQTFSAGLSTTTSFQTEANALFSAIKASDINKNTLAPIVLSLLDNIDTSLCVGMTLFANSANIADQMIRDATFLQDTLFASLVRLVNTYGCILVVGRNKAYIVPEAAYLKIPKTQNLYRGVRGANYNIIMPVEYENFSFNDAGDNTVKGVYVIDDPRTSLNNLGTSSTSVLSGVYVDPAPNVFGNVVVRTLPNFATIANAYAVGVGSLGIQKLIANQNNLITAKVDSDTSLNSLERVNNTIQNNAIAPAQQFLNDWAQVEYCKIKYDDRTGNISSAFKNIFVPGAVGSLYTRQPGLYIDFFVSNVTHSFQLSAPSTGNATTNVTFKCGRIGSATYNGIDRLALYDYGYDTSVNYCNNFIANIS